MTAQLQLDLGVGGRGSDIAGITRRLLDELEYHLSTPVLDPVAEPLEAWCHDRLVAGCRLLLAWLDEQASPLPYEALPWPCTACQVPPGQLCLWPDSHPRTRPPEEDVHIGRGLHGRWSTYALVGPRPAYSPAYSRPDRALVGRRG